MKIKCSSGLKISELYSFGLAFGNETIMGTDNSPRGTPSNKTLKTVDRCSLGTMEDLRLEQQIEKQFAADCLGKGVCSMFLNFTAIFDEKCLKEMKERLAGNTFYGPPQVLALTQCVQEELKVTGKWIISKDKAAKIVVGIDLSIILVFVLAIFRLKFYE
jgi:hypothetical protein